MEPSSANKGFFQQQPILKNQLYDDISLQRVIKCEPRLLQGRHNFSTLTVKLSVSTVIGVREC